MASMRTRARGKRQTQLSFSPAPTSSPSKSSQPEAARDRSAFVRIDDSPSPMKKRRTHVDMLPTPRPSIEIHVPPLSSSPARRTRSFMDGNASSPVPTKRRAKHARRPVIEDSESEECLEKLPPKAGLHSFNDSESDDPVMRSSPTKSKPRNRGSKPDPFIVDDSSDDPSPPRRIKNTRQRRPSLSESDQEGEATDDGEDDDDIPVRHGRQQRSSQSPYEPLDEQDQADLDSDLEFLGSGDVEPSSSLPSRQPPSKKQDRYALLDKLKKRRDQRQINGSGATQQMAGSVSDEGSADEDSLSEEHMPDDNGDWQYVAEDHDDIFVVDDGEDGGAGLPVEFSRYATMKASELFPWVVEWMVQKKINPGFAMTDEVYDIAFRRLDDYVKGLGSSKFQSSAWTPKFNQSLLGRPKLDETRIPASPDRDRCDACNRSGHSATYEVRFTGPTYNKQTLEEDSDEDSDEDETVLPGTETVYYIGKQCMANAKQAHALRHWKFHLKDWVVDYLREEGELTANKIVKRDGSSTKKRSKEAERILDTMRDTGEVRTLHRDFKSEIEAAAMTNNEAQLRGSSP